MPDDNNPNLLLLVGQLVEATKQTHETVNKQTGAIENLAREVQDSAHQFRSLEEKLKKTNGDIMQLREYVVTPEKLRMIGLHMEQAEEHKKDFAHLRDLREAHEEINPVKKKIKTGVIIAILSAIIGWGIPKAAEYVMHSQPEITDHGN